MKKEIRYIDKDALVAEITNLKVKYECGWNCAIDKILDYIDDLEVKDPYEQCVQYDSIKAGIQAHAETYSFNIESNLFNQLTKEQQKLWRKEIEQACVNGGEVGAELARDTRYKENLEVKEVNLEKEIDVWYNTMGIPITTDALKETARYFFELGLNHIKSNKNE